MSLLVVFTGAAGLAAAPALADPASVKAQEWWIGTLGLDKVWQISKGAGVTVAVLDAGVQASVGDLRGAVVPGFAASGAGNGETDTDTRNHHGTRMASLIAGRGVSPGMVGVAPQAKILPVLVPDNGSVEDTVAALNHLSAMSKPPQVVNMSYGGGGSCPDDLQDAVKRAVDRGMILVSSAGNEGSSTNESESPSNCAGVVSVGAFGVYGSHGTTLKAWPDSQRQSYVSLAAPGIHMIGYDPPSTAFFSGTSDAAAIVSGSIAVARAHFPNMPSRQLVARFIATARQFVGASGTHSDVSGWGAARPHHALTDNVPASAPNPIYDALDKLGGPSSSAPDTGTSQGQSQGATTINAPPPNSPAPVAGESGSSSSNTGIIVGVLVAVLVIAAIVITVLVRGRRGPQRLR